MGTSAGSALARGNEISVSGPRQFLSARQEVAIGAELTSTVGAVFGITAEGIADPALSDVSESTVAFWPTSSRRMGSSKAPSR